MTNLISLLPLLLAAQPALEDLDALDARLAEISDGTTARIDRRLRLVRCPAPPTIQPSAQSGFEVTCPARGWRLQVPLSPNRADPAGKASPMLVLRGESVKVAITGEDFAVEYRAVAVDAGRMGDTVRVKFAGSRSPMAATVSGQGKVSMVD